MYGFLDLGRAILVILPDLRGASSKKGMGAQRVILEGASFEHEAGVGVGRLLAAFKH